MAVASDIYRILPSNGVDGEIGARAAYRDEGSLTLTANFDRGTLTGTDGVVDFDGTISGQDISGTVDVDYYSSRYTFYRDETLTAEMQGEIGSTGVIGEFKGTDGEQVSVAGGFTGTAN